MAKGADSGVKGRLVGQGQMLSEQRILSGQGQMLTVKGRRSGQTNESFSEFLLRDDATM